MELRLLTLKSLDCLRCLSEGPETEGWHPQDRSTSLVEAPWTLDVTKPISWYLQKWSQLRAV